MSKFGIGGGEAQLRRALQSDPELRAYVEGRRLPDAFEAAERDPAEVARLEERERARLLEEGERKSRENAERSLEIARKREYEAALRKEKQTKAEEAFKKALHPDPEWVARAEADAEAMRGRFAAAPSPGGGDWLASLGPRKSEPPAAAARRERARVEAERREKAQKLLEGVEAKVKEAIRALPPTFGLARYPGGVFRAPGKFKFDPQQRVVIQVDRQRGSVWEPFASLALEDLVTGMTQVASRALTVHGRFR